MFCVSSAVQIFSLCLPLFILMSLFLPYLFHSHLGFFHPCPSSCLGPSPTLPFPAVGSQPALLQLPRQPVSFSPKLLANRVEQPGPGDQEEGKPLSGQSALHVRSPGPHCTSTGAGPWGTMLVLQVGGSIPFLIKQATWRRKAPT